MEQSAEILSYLNTLLKSPAFAPPRRRAELLRYLVERTLAGESATISEFGIGLDVYGKPDSFDPRIDSTVRSDMSRLRKSLSDYYADKGAADPFRITFPDRGYIPLISGAEEPATQPVTNRAPASRWKWVLIGSIAAAVSGLALWKVTPPRRTMNSVVVLPFSNMTGDPSRDYIADGITEQLTDALAQVQSLRVVARTSAYEFRNKGVDVREIGRKLDVDAVVEGSIRKTDNGYRLTVQLNRAADGYHVLSQSFDGRVSELARLQGAVAVPVIAALHPAEGPRTPSATRPEPNPEAYDLYLKAMALYGPQLTPDGYERSIALLEQAIEKDPRYAKAYSALAEIYMSFAMNATRDPKEMVPPAMAAAQKALELDPSVPGAYAAEGIADAMFGRNWKRGEDELRHALRLMPSYPKGHNWLGLVLLVQGKFKEALGELRAGDKLAPLNPAPTVARALYFARKYDESLEECARMLRIHPNQHMIHLMMGVAWEQKGDYAHARQEYETFLRKLPAGAGSYEYAITHLQAVSGEASKARQTLARWEEQNKGPDKPDAWTLVELCAALGERDKAFRWLEQAFAAGDFKILKIDPMLDPLRDDPRYAEFLKKAGLSE